MVQVGLGGWLALGAGWRPAPHQKEFHSSDLPTPPTSTPRGMEMARALPPPVYPGPRLLAAWMPARTVS